MSNKFSKLLNYKKIINRDLQLKTEKIVDFKIGDRVFISNVNDIDIDSLKNNVFYRHSEYPYNLKSFRILSVNNNNIIIDCDQINQVDEIEDYYISKYSYIANNITEMYNMDSVFINNTNILDSSISEGYIGIYKGNILENIQILSEKVIIEGKDRKHISGLDFYIPQAKIFNSRIENGIIKNCHLKNTKFVHVDNIGANSNIITGGKFYNCIIEDYIIEGGEFYDCVLRGDYTVWKDGEWYDSTKGWDIGYMYINLGLSSSFINSIKQKNIIEIIGYSFNLEIIEKYLNHYNVDTELFEDLDVEERIDLLRQCLTYKYNVWNGGKFKNGYAYIDFWINGSCDGGKTKIFLWENGEVSDKSKVIVNEWKNGTINGGTLEWCNVWRKGKVLNGILTGEYNKYDNLIGVNVSTITTIEDCEVNGGAIIKGQINTCIMKSGILSNIDSINVCRSYGGSINGCNIITAICEKTDIKSAIITQNNGTKITVPTVISTAYLTNCHLYEVNEIYDGLTTECYFIKCNFNNTESKKLEFIKSNFDDCTFNKNRFDEIYYYNGTHKKYLIRNDKFGLFYVTSNNKYVLTDVILTNPDGLKYEEINLINCTIKNSDITYCNLYSNDITNSNIYISEFFDGTFKGGSINNTIWHYGVFVDGEFIYSKWIGGLFEEISYITTSLYSKHLEGVILTKPKRIVPYVK